MKAKLSDVLLYLLLVSALLPATQLLGLTFFGLFILISEAEFTLDYLLTVFSMLLGICGYVGFLLMLKGLHKTNHFKKLMLLLGGFSGFLIFMLHASPRDFVDWLLDYDMEALVGKWPLVVNLFFVIMLLIDLVRKRRVKKADYIRQQSRSGAM